MEPITVTYSQLCDMIDDAQGAWRVHLSEHPAEREWSSAASESSAMWRAIALLFGVRYTAGYHKAFDHVSTQVKAYPESACGTLAINLMKHMREGS
jgi:hypothetical protein